MKTDETIEMNPQIMFGKPVIKHTRITDLDNLPDPDELANDIIENLEAAVESFKEIAQRI